jgi:ATP-binding cassette subfamily B protein
MFGGPGPVGAPTEKAKDLKGTLKKLAHHLRPYWGKLSVVLIFAIASTAFAIASPKILGHATNQIVDDYVAMKAYDAIMENLPVGVTLPAGTTGADVLDSIPAAERDNIPSSQIDSIKSLDLSTRPTFHFEAIRSIIVLLLALYLLSAALSYIQG